MNCGCSYELFWKLNPHKLESFYEAERRKLEDEMTAQNTYAWLYGSYVAEAVASILGKHHRYPEKPKDLKTNHREEIEAPPGECMSDGQRFYLFMLEHNKAMAKKKRRNK